MVEKSIRLNLYRAAVKLWGVDSQLDAVIEEMAELTAALIHFRRFATITDNSSMAMLNIVRASIVNGEPITDTVKVPAALAITDVIDELADVSLTLESTLDIFRRYNPLTTIIKRRKLYRLNNLINSSQNKLGYSANCIETV